MSIQAKGGTISQKTTTGSQGYTGVGFQPKVVIFWGGGQTAAGKASHALFHFGASDGSNSFSCRMRSRDAVGTSAVSAQENTGPVSIYDKTGTSVAAASLSSLDSDGFTLNWTGTDGTARKINYLALGGSDLLANVGSFAEQDTGITGVGFKPSVLIFAAVNTGRAGLSFVTADDEWNICGDSENGVGTSNTMGQLGNYAWQRVAASTGAFQSAANLVSMDSDGFTLTWPSSAGTPNVNFIAIGGCKANLQTFTSSPVLTTPPAISETIFQGFSPICSLFMSDGKASSSPGPTAHHRLAFGVGVGVGVAAADQRSAGRADNDNVGTTQTEQSHSETRCLEVMDASNPSVIVESLRYDGILAHPSPLGAYFSWQSHDGTSRKHVILGIGPPSGTATRSQAVCT